MSTMQEETRMASQDLLDQISALAKMREHRLGKGMTGDRPLTLVSALRIRGYLSGRPDKPAAEREGVHLPAPGPMAAAERRVNGTGRRPGAKITEPGIFFHNDRIYKVLRSEYSGHLQARRMDPKTCKFSYAEGMMGVLREEDRMTPEQSRRYEELFGHAVCTDCGLPLENDLSRERRVGPVCWVKNGHGA